MEERRGRGVLIVSAPLRVTLPLHWVVTGVLVEPVEPMMVVLREQLPLRQPLLALSALYLQLSQGRF